VATIRHITLNLLRAGNYKHNFKGRRKYAARDTAYLEAILRQAA